MIKQKVKNLLKQATIKNREEIDNEIREIQMSRIKKVDPRYSTGMQEYLEKEIKEKQTDMVMRSIKKDIEQYGYTSGKKLA